MRAPSCRAAGRGATAGRWVVWAGGRTLGTVGEREEELLDELQPRLLARREPLGWHAAVLKHDSLDAREADALLGEEAQ